MMPRRYLMSLPVIFSMIVVVFLSYILVGLRAYQRGASDVTQVASSSGTVVAAVPADPEAMIIQKQIEYFKETFLPLYPELMEKLAKEDLQLLSSATLDGRGVSEVNDFTNTQPFPVWIVKDAHGKAYVVTSEFWLAPYVEPDFPCQVNDVQLYQFQKKNTHYHRTLLTYTCNSLYETVLIDLNTGKILPITDPRKLLQAAGYEKSTPWEFYNPDSEAFSIRAARSPWKGEALEYLSSNINGSTEERVDFQHSKISGSIDLTTGQLTKVYRF